MPAYNDGFLDLPERPGKPRTEGLTHVMDKGLNLRDIEGLFDTAGQFVDIVKFGWATSMVVQNLDAKLEAFRSNNIDVCCGGSLFELAVVKKQGQPVSKVCHRFDPLPQVMKNVRYKSGKPLENAKVRLAIKSAEQKLNGQGRLVIRPSGTEPVIRVMGEGDDKTLVEDVVDGIVEALTDVAA